ncbi:unnamed protein product [Symbiodinium microadriaticum]|nr:unnamed protein product [Symbiodinium microadriaticum]
MFCWRGRKESPAPLIAAADKFTLLAKCMGMQIVLVLRGCPLESSRLGCVRLRSAQQATADMQGALDAFRKDPLELLEWKAPREARETAARTFAGSLPPRVELWYDGAITLAHARQMASLSKERRRNFREGFWFQMV